MQSSEFSVTVNKETGGIRQLILRSDRHEMNWIRPERDWGVPREAEFVSAEIGREKAVSVYRNQRVMITVERFFGDNGNLKESYRIKNITGCDVFIKKAIFPYRFLSRILTRPPGSA